MHICVHTFKHMNIHVYVHRILARDIGEKILLIVAEDKSGQLVAGALNLIGMCDLIHLRDTNHSYGVARVSRIDEIIGLFCKRVL